MLIDSHCHLLSGEYDNVDDVIKNAFESGIDKLIINGYDLASSRQAVNLSKKYKNVYAAVGIGPENIIDFSDEVIDEIDKLSKETKTVAIGEIGLDYYWTKANKNEQINVFKKLILLANKNKLPVIVHNREATKDVYDILKENNAKGIIHCFSGSLESAREFIKLGFLIGIGGVVTFKNAEKIKNIVKEIPITSISLETDSPYLSPEPFRGKTNDPSKIIYVVKKIAEIKGLDESAVINYTGRSVMSKFDL